MPIITLLTSHGYGASVSPVAEQGSARMVNLERTRYRGTAPMVNLGKTRYRGLA
jgi:hypothetical protein